MTYIDAHNHLQDVRLDPRRAEITVAVAELPVQIAVVNGTREADWEAVSALARELPWVRPAFGLHPWFVAGRSPDWLEKLVHLLDSHPDASIGEIGLDRWIEGYDLPAQKEVFQAQLSLAAKRDLPATIHCLKAWGALDEAVRETPPPARGFLLHSFGGSEEMATTLAERGAYFSFSPYFLRPGKEKQQNVFTSLPVDRLLAETDAPDMPPHDAINPLQLGVDENNKPINHPANIALSYKGLAKLRGMAVEALAAQLQENFIRLFGKPLHS